MNTPPAHSLFQRYPLTETVTLSTGSAPVPYQIYDGYGLFVGGTADFDRVKTLLNSSEIAPIRNEDGRALMGLWICDFTQASLGAHHELQFSIFIQRQQVPPVSRQRMGLLAAMLQRRDMQMLCHGLYNNTPQVVAYNRELLSLNARLTTSRIHRQNHQIDAAFTDAATGDRLLEASFKDVNRASWGALAGLTRQLGMRETLAVNCLPWITMEVVNPPGVKLAHYGVAQAFTSNAVNVIQYFDPRKHTLTSGRTPYAALDFQPQFVQFMDGFKFVYLNPV